MSEALRPLYKLIPLSGISSRAVYHFEATGQGALSWVIGKKGIIPLAKEYKKLGPACLSPKSKGLAGRRHLVWIGGMKRSCYKIAG